MKPAPELHRPGLLSHVCRCCGGDGRGEVATPYGFRSTACQCCGGKGHVITRAPQPPKEQEQ